MQYIKNFLRWIGVKEKLDSNSSKPPFVNEGEVWWFYCGENIGTEVSGKSDSFTRPCIIYKKFSQYTFFIIPLSSKIKQGTWYSSFIFQQKKQIACLHQAKSIDYRRLKTFMGQVSEKECENLKQDFEHLYIKNRPPRITKG